MRRKHELVMGWIGCLVGCFLVLGAGPALSETRYVSDVLYVSLRAGQGDDDQVLRVLKSDTPLELLEETDESAHVRTEDGLEGWIKKRYITDELPKAMIIANLQKENASLKEHIERIEKERSELKSDLYEDSKQDAEKLSTCRKALEAARSEVAQQTSTAESWKNQYDDLMEKSGKVVGMVKSLDACKHQNQVLEKEKAQIRTEAQAISKENKRLFRMMILRWFLAGAGVLLAGVILGKMSKRKRYY